MSPQEQRRVVEQFWAAMQANDWAAAAAFLHDEYLLEWPQSGEQIRGFVNFVSIQVNYPASGPWRFTVHRIVAGEDGVVSDVGVTDGTQVARAITFSTLRDGLIVHQTEFWPDPMEAAPWRAAWVERTIPRPQRKPRKARS